MVQSIVQTTTNIDVEVVEKPILKPTGKKIGILGGTFNPPHMGHLVMAEQVGTQLGLDEVWFLPDYIPPHVDKKDAIPAKHRIKMVELAISNNPLFKLDLTDINRGGVSYTVDTIRILKEQYPQNEYYFIIGGDMVAYLPKWYKIDELSHLVQFVGIKRPNFKTESRYPIIWVDAPENNISSSMIRKNIEHGQSIRYLVPEMVEDYIKEHHLYGYK